MGMLDCLAHGDEQLEPVADRQAAMVAVVRDHRATYQLHHEVRHAFGRGPAIVDAGDVRVIHEGQGLPFRIETRHHGPRILAGLDQLECHLPLDRLGLVGEVYEAEAALADQLDECVPSRDDGPRRHPPDIHGMGYAIVRPRTPFSLVFPRAHVPEMRGLIEIERRARGGRRARIDRGQRSVCRQQPYDRGVEFRIRSTPGRKEFFALRWSQFEAGLEQFLDAIRIDGHRMDLGNRPGAAMI